MFAQSGSEDGKSHVEGRKTVIDTASLRDNAARKRGRHRFKSKGRRRRVQLSHKLPGTPDDRPFNKAQMTAVHAPVKHSGKFSPPLTDMTTDARALKGSLHISRHIFMGLFDSSVRKINMVVSKSELLIGPFCADVICGSPLIPVPDRNLFCQGGVSKLQLHRNNGFPDRHSHYEASFLPSRRSKGKVLTQDIRVLIAFYCKR